MQFSVHCGAIVAPPTVSRRGRVLLRRILTNQWLWNNWRASLLLDILRQLRPRGHSERSASITLMRAARAAGTDDATTAAASSTNAETTTGMKPGIFISTK